MSNDLNLPEKLYQCLDKRYSKWTNLTFHHQLTLSVIETKITNYNNNKLQLVF